MEKILIPLDDLSKSLTVPFTFIDGTGTVGQVVLTIDNKVLFITDSTTLDITSKYKIATRDNNNL